MRFKTGLRRGRWQGDVRGTGWRSWPRRREGCPATPRPWAWLGRSRAAAL